MSGRAVQLPSGGFRLAREHRGDTEHSQAPVANMAVTMGRDTTLWTSSFGCEAVSLLVVAAVFVTGLQTLVYNAREEDNGLVVGCSAEQRDSEGWLLQDPHQATLTLHITNPAPPPPRAVPM